MSFTWDTEYFKASDGNQVAFRFAMPEKADSIVLWAHAISHCSNIYRVVAKQFYAYQVGICMIDMRGHGETPGKKGDLIEVGDLENDIHTLLDILAQRHPGKPIFLIGHSAGCLPVLRYLKKYRNSSQISGISLIVPAIDMNPFEMEYSVYDRKGSTFFYRLKYHRKKPNINVFPEKYKKSFEFKLNKFVLLFSPYFKSLRSCYLTTNAPEEKYSLQDQSPRITYNFFKGMEIETPHYSNFEQISVPVLLVGAQNDEIIDPDALQVIFNWHLNPNVRRKFFVQPNSSHIDVVYRIVHKLAKWVRDEIQIIEPDPSKPIVDDANILETRHTTTRKTQRDI